MGLLTCAKKKVWVATESHILLAHTVSSTALLNGCSDPQPNRGTQCSSTVWWLVCAFGGAETEKRAAANNSSNLVSVLVSNQHSRKHRRKFVFSSFSWIIWSYSVYKLYHDWWGCSGEIDGENEIGKITCVILVAPCNYKTKTMSLCHNEVRLILAYCNKL